MATNIWRGGTPAVPQVVSVTPANVEVGDIFRITVTDDQGASVQISYTAQAATVADVTAGLTAAWNASVDPLCRYLTAADQTTSVSLTSDLAGVPFSVTTSTVNGGAVNDQTLTAAVVTANSGPNDAKCAANWTLGVPVALQDLVFPAGTADVLYNLDFAATTFGQLSQERGHGRIGRWGLADAYAPLAYFRCQSCSGLRIMGSGGLTAFDVGSANVTPIIDHAGTPDAQGKSCVYLRGTNLASLDQRSGYAAVAGAAGDTATVRTSFLVAGGYLTIGSGCTVTGTAAYVKGGSLTTYAGIPTSYVYKDGVLYQEGTPTPGASWYVYQGGLLHPNAGGTYATVEVHGSGQVLNTLSLVAKTFTTTRIYNGGVLKDPAQRITFTNPPTYYGGFQTVP